MGTVYVKCDTCNSDLEISVYQDCMCVEPCEKRIDNAYNDGYEAREKEEEK